MNRISSVSVALPQLVGPAPPSSPARPPPPQQGPGRLHQLSWLKTPSTRKWGSIGRAQ